MKTISSIWARTLVGKGCSVFLAHLWGIGTMSLFIESILMVLEFSKVFIMDLPSISPDRDLYFYID